MDDKEKGNLIGTEQLQEALLFRTALQSCFLLEVTQENL